MIYNEYQELNLSSLGFGAMRLPVIAGDYMMIDETEAGRMIDYAMAQGINYYDTAWGYHDGQSEIALGKALSRFPRESFYLASKFPGYESSNWAKVEMIFDEQLQKCGVDYFDFYLFHNVCEMNIDAYLDPEYGIFDYLIKQRENGRIRHLGFSVHGSYDVMKRFLEAYGDKMEFCQIQLNYLDWTFQNAKAKVELSDQYSIPVWVMEPLRGGSLCKLSVENEAKLHLLRPNETITAWAFRFVQSMPSVKVVLSGMTTFDQLVENIRTFEDEKPLTEDERDTLYQIVEDMLKKKILPCTACRYCTGHCPQELDIPSLLTLYNEHTYTGGGFLAPMALMALSNEKKPSACIACRSCEEVCPQQIKISEAMLDFAQKMSI